jgi:AbrB family looped-hinge helix DNA binding protein
MEHFKMQFFGTGTVGERGQIVIPASARQEMEVKPGDQFVFFAHGKILHLVKATEMEQLLESISSKFENHLKEYKNMLKNRKGE